MEKCEGGKWKKTRTKLKYNSKIMLVTKFLNVETTELRTKKAKFIFILYVLV